MPVKDIETLLKKFDLSQEAIALIQNIRNSDPSRKVKSNKNNVPGFYPSKKMGLTIQFESHKLELAGIYEKEHDSDVIEYYDQPPSFNISYDAPEGSKKNKIGHRYTPDFFVIEKDWIGWEEWKTDEELIKLSQANPNRYLLDQDGNWHCPPAENFAEKFGLSFRVRSSKDIDWTYLRNIKFLEDYLLDENPYVSPDAASIIKKLIGDKPSIILDKLLNNQSHFTADDIYTMIVTDELYVDLKNYLIVDFDKFPLFLNKQVCHAYQNMEDALRPLELKPTTIDIHVGNKINWDGRVCTLINIGENVITLLIDNEKTTDIPKTVFEELIIKGSITEIKSIEESEEERIVNEMIRGASEKDLEEANRRYFIVQGMLNGGEYADFEAKDRTIRDWMKKYRDAEKILGNGFVGLLPKTKNQGNRVRRFEEDVILLMGKYIEEDFETIKQKQATTVYNAFKKECEKKGYIPPSFKTFLSEVDKRPIHEQIQKRQGSKAAYTTKPFYYELSMTTPRHGDRPFEICHIDHTELDIVLICSETEEVLGKPWITFLIDAFSRRILAFYLTFDPPSYRSNMMVLRECVRRHSKLPDMIVVDGGKDFQSVYFDTLLARYGKGKKVRPGAKPKFGSVCERLFGTTNDMFIHNLLGNTQIMKNYRQVTKEVNPKIHAVWTLEELNSMFKQWCYEIYDKLPHSTLDGSPRDTFIKRVAKTGNRKNTFIKYDETFKMLTFPTTKKGTAKVITGRGVKINYFYYFSEILLHPDVEEKQIPVRYDPFNLGIAYAYVNKYWVELTCENYNVMVNRTEKELKIITEEIRKRKKLFGQKRDLSSSQIVDFIESAESYEFTKLQQLKDRAVKQTLTVIEGGKNADGTSANRNKETESRKETNKQSNESPKLTVVKSNIEKSSYRDILEEMKKENSFTVYKEL